MLLFDRLPRDNDVMKPTEQLVASIRELRFAVDRLSDAEMAKLKDFAKAMQLF